jgi:hypothetical protein
MFKKIKPGFFLLISFLFIQSSYGQMQKDMSDYLKQKFLRYIAAIPREEIFLHSDRDEYLAGEDLWFNVYLIDRQSSKQSLTSKIAYFELLNPENRPVVQKRILLRNGVGPGQIILPDTLSTGKYTIRVYTSWMKNFLPYNCFMKNITIYNTISTKEFMGEFSTANSIKNSTADLTIKEINKPDVNLNVDNSRPDILEIIVTADDKFRSENKDIFYIFIQTRGNFNYVSNEKITAKTTNINISKTVLSEGINQITIFNSNGEPVCERFIYTPVKENDFFTIHSVDSSSLRNKITLDIERANEVSNALNSAQLSISVSPKTNDHEIWSINDYLVFGSEYGLLPLNTVKNKRIKDIPPEVMDSILLNVRSNWINWPTILSGDLPQFKFHFEKEYHYLEGKLINNDQEGADSAEYIFLCTPGKEAVFQYARRDPEGNFSFNIHIDEGINDFIIMPGDFNKNHKIIIESSFSDQYIQSGISVDTTIKQIPPHISEWSVNYQVSKIYKVPTLEGPMDPVFLPLKPIRFYGKPDFELIMADYISLPVMEEVFFEILPHVSLKKKNSVYEILITDRIDDTPYIITPILLVDGVFIKDPAIVANLDPVLVEKIDVIKEQYLVGKYFFTGIVNVITRSGDFSSVPLPDYMIRFPYRVLDPVWSFVSPDYSSSDNMNSRIPDFRNTLYWNPSVKTDKSGQAKIEFWSSDVVSDYEINIQGINSDGKPISAKKYIRVE